MSYLDDFYSQYDEDARLISRHGQVEYLTTRKYIKECLAGLFDPSILEVGAGTGRYSVTLAKEGYSVTAIELVEHNLELLRAKLDGTERIKTMQGNALDLSVLSNDSFDLTLVLGPMYHLYTKEDKLRALSEAIRVTKPGGHILVAYCMNEPTIIQYVFKAGSKNLEHVLDDGLLTPDWHCISEPKEVFELARTEDIADLDAAFAVERLKLVATDGATNYMKDCVDEMDDKTFAKWLEFHFATCERKDLIGASHHTLDILKKRVDRPGTNYPLLLEQAKALAEASQDPISLMANLSALLFQELKEINWAGFYLVKNGALLLGPFQGKVACVKIEKGKGVCGTAWAKDEVQLVSDVHAFPGHIACDSASRSEIVLPIHRANEVVAVLDIDSPLLARFDERDQVGLLGLVELLEKSFANDRFEG